MLEIAPLRFVNHRARVLGPPGREPTGEARVPDHPDTELLFFLEGQARERAGEKAAVLFAGRMSVATVAQGERCLLWIDAGAASVEARLFLFRDNHKYVVKVCLADDTDTKETLRAEASAALQHATGGLSA